MIELTQGPILKNIIKFSLPLMASNLLQVLFNMSDIAVVGHFAGSAALGAVGSTAQLVFFFTGVIIGLASGVNVIVAYWIGSNSKKDLFETLQTGFIICLLIGVILAIVGVAAARPVLFLMNTKDELLDGAALYFIIYMTGLPALSLYNFAASVMSAAGDTKRPLIYLTVAGVLNIALNLFFVIVLKMSVAGVALASSISLYVSATLAISHLLKTKSIIHLTLSHLTLNVHKARQILKLGIPAGLQNAIFAFANIFIQVGVNTFSATMVAGNAIASNADPIVYESMGALYIACASFIGQNYGAAKKERVIKSYLYSMASAVVLGVVFGVALHIYSDGFLRLFTRDSAVIECAKQRLSIMSASYFIAAFMDCTIAASRGLAKTFMPSVFVILGSCVFRIIWIKTIFAHFMTIESLFLLYAFSWAITAIAQIIYFLLIYKKAFSGQKIK